MSFLTTLLEIISGVGLITQIFNLITELLAALGVGA